MRPSHEPSTRKFGPLVTADDWQAVPYSLRGATKLTVSIAGNGVEVQLSRSQPPEPPTWDDSIPLSAGGWTHAGLFGHWRFRSQTPGAPATVSGAAFSD